LTLDRALSARNLQDVGADEDDDDGAFGNFFFTTTTFCHNNFWGLFGSDVFETAQVWQLLEFLHYGHGDQPGTCASACDNVCNHQPCFDDFEVSDGGDRCECIRNLSQSRCASSNSRCVEDECECLEGFAGNPTVSCENIDECSDSELNNCGPNAECIDQSPGFTCECEKGYSGDPFSTIGCEDDNECLDSDICGSQGTCDNTGKTDREASTLVGCSILIRKLSNSWNCCLSWT